jgi:hypothetical protein
MSVPPHQRLRFSDIAAGESRPYVRVAMPVRSILVRTGVIAVLAMSFWAVASGIAVAATQTTISFDDLSPGAKVSTQYDADGVDFANGIVGSNVYCYPVITKLATGQAESGTQVADASCANGEFPNSSIRGLLKNSAKNISVYAGFSPSSTPPTSVAVTLTAYDINDNVVDSSSATVSAGQGTHTQIAVSSASANIVAFDVTSTQAHVSIDDLTFDNPSGVPADFGIRAANGLVQVPQGSAVQDVVSIQRLDGSTGGITFSTSGLPAGVHASFSPDPATGDTTTMTVSADPTASPPPAGPYPGFTITGTPDDAGAGSTARSTSVLIDVQLLFTTSYPGPIKVPPCSTLQVPITVTAASGFSGSVTLSATGVPADDQASFSPATLTLPGQTHSTLTLTSESDISAPAANVTIVAAGGGVTDASGTFSVSRVPPSITSLTGLSATDKLSGGRTPQGDSPDQGTVVVIHGQGFCPGSTVYFGNALAIAPTEGPPAPDGGGPFGDEKILMTSVPSLATTGNVYVVPQGGTLLTPGTATAPFTIDSYRDVDGFSFDNSQQFQDRVGGYSFGDVSDVFGDEQTHVSINPCSPVYDCTVTTPIPNPGALIFWGIANAMLQDGQCFGFSLASQRLLHGDQIYPAFPAQSGLTADNAWNLQGPDGAGGASGASSTLAHYVHLMHLEQLSSQVLNFWLTHAAANLVAGSQGSIMGDVTAALNRGDHPIIMLQNGLSGHAVVAYGVDQANGSSEVGSGDRVIDVYNPNAEFKTGENAIDGTTHQTTLANSEIIVHSNGHWVFPGFSPAWSGGPGSLVVMPYGVVPVHPTLPASLTGLFDLVFGSADATQVTDSSGHTLLNSDGTINTDPTTGIADATQFATQSGSATPGPGIFLFGHTGTYTTTVQGNGTGMYHDALFAHGAVMSLTAATSAGVTDAISAPASIDGLQFGQISGAAGTSRPATVQLVVNGAQQSQRTATIVTGVPAGGRAGVAFDATHNSVEVTAGADPTSYTLSLSWTGPHGLPQTFVAPKVQLAAGEQATVTPANWSSLQSTRVILRVRHKNGRTTTRTLKNRTHPSGRYTVALKTARTRRTEHLTISTRFARSARGSSALLTFEVLKGRRVVAGHSVSLTAAQVRHGLVKRTFSFKVTGSARYVFRGAVELLTPTDGAYTSHKVTRQRGFSG